ncbi:hypothetical protein P171DRAFT_445768 [Karstenula rhodostoma CBS 690.94]|uniref:Uncharacterized protein n=1 Tax=Karstenula rhodostoma CBS 690.94 TaxID=1392251 RepID=A0A9P4PBJ3_9PLEO|nr:hypothetical protein P171DRAFT_445768 [Karstenula rhodostoma CBS 690.94]
MMQHMRGRGRCIGFVVIALIILILHVITFTGCTSKFAATPIFHLLTIRKGDTWLRVNYFGACFGDASGLLACAPTMGSADAVVAKLNLDAGKAAAAIFLVKYAQKIQSSGLMPWFPLAADLCFVVSAVTFVLMKDSSLLWQPRHMSNYATFKMAFVGIAFLVCSMVQILASVGGMASAIEMVERPQFKIEKNIIVIMILQGIAGAFQAGFIVLMFRRCRRVEREMMHGNRSRRVDGARQHRPRNPMKQSSRRPR